MPYLVDILESIDLINSYVEQINHSKENFEKNIGN